MKHYKIKIFNIDTNDMVLEFYYDTEKDVDTLIKYLTKKSSKKEPLLTFKIYQVTQTEEILLKTINT